MNIHPSLFRASLVLAGMIFLTSPARASDSTNTNYVPVEGEFDPLGHAVVMLLQTHSASNFTAKVVVKGADYQSLITTNSTAKQIEAVKPFTNTDNSLKVIRPTHVVLKRAEALPTDATNLTFHVEMPARVQKMIFGSSSSDDVITIPYVEHLDIHLAYGVESNLTIRLQGVEKFPTGWRVSQGISWTAFPTNLISGEATRELVIQEKIVSNKPINDEDDPSLLEFGQRLIGFLRNPDTNGLTTNLCFGIEDAWAMIQASGQKGPSRQEYEEGAGPYFADQRKTSVQLVALMKKAGIDLKTADIQIKKAEMQSARAENPTNLSQISGNRFELSLLVKSDAKAATGASLSGEYILALKEITKANGKWRAVTGLQFSKIPEGVLDAKAVADLEFEDYVAKYNAIPANIPAPEIEFTTLVGEKQMKLSELRGKIVILDFWATWCGPCQGPMAESQKLMQEHPDWKDKVAVVPLSIDDTLEIVRKHVNQRGWTNTFNVWAGPGGWHSSPAQAYRVSGVPHAFVIDPKGTITTSVSPIFGDSIASAVEQELKK